MTPLVQITASIPAQLLLRDRSTSADSYHHAVLQKLSQGTAIVHVTDVCEASWGDTVRLQVSDGEQVTELEGGVIAVCHGGHEGVLLAVRCWSHYVCAQRRKLPRLSCNRQVEWFRGQQIPVVIPATVPGVCTEIGAGGMRLITAASCEVNDMVMVLLPVGEVPRTKPPLREEFIAARVKRKRRSSTPHEWELALKFEMISTRQGLMLADLFAA